MIRVFLVLAVLASLIWLAMWLGRSSPAQRSQSIRAILIYGTAGILLLLVIAGRIHWLFAILGATVPWLQRALFARQAWRMFKSTRKPSAGNTSKVETGYFRMVLNHDSGDLTGQVLHGDFAGQQIESLPLEQLLILLTECRLQDPHSAALLEAYLDRRHGDVWRDQDTSRSSSATASTGPMTRRKAAEILGVAEDVSDDSITEAHRRLIQRLHSDRGGSDYLASLINQARDVLLDD